MLCCRCTIGIIDGAAVVYLNEMDHESASITLSRPSFNLKLHLLLLQCAKKTFLLPRPTQCRTAPQTNSQHLAGKSRKWYNDDQDDDDDEGSYVETRERE